MLLIALGMFAMMFFILNVEDLDAFDDGDQYDWDLTDSRPFHSPFYSFLSVYQMIFGDFQIVWFQTETQSLTACSIVLFMLFMFFVVVVMLNVLIAIVSDSYDFALTRSEKLFLRARLQLLAELDALGLTKTDFMLFGKNIWSNNGSEGTGSIMGIVLVIGSIFRLRSNATSDDGREASANAEWTGRVLHIEKTTEEVVTEHVEKGVGKLMDYLATQADRLKKLDDRLNRQEFDQKKRDAAHKSDQKKRDAAHKSDQEKRDAALEEKEKIAAKNQLRKESDHRKNRETFERKVLDAIEEVTGKELRASVR